MAIFATALKVAKTKGSVHLRKISKEAGVKPTLEQLNEAKKWDRRIEKSQNLKNTVNTLLKSQNPILDLLANQYHYEMKSNGKITKKLKERMKASGLKTKEVNERSKLIRRRSKQMDKLTKSPNFNAVVDVLQGELNTKIKTEEKEKEKLKRLIKTNILALENELLFKYTAVFDEQTPKDLSEIIDFKDQRIYVDFMENPTWNMVFIISKLVDTTVLDLEHNTSPDLIIEYQEEFILTTIESFEYAVEDIKNTIILILED